MTITQSTDTLAEGATVSFVAVARDASGAVLADRVIGWTSSNASAATVTAHGVVQAIYDGTATITATAEGHSAARSVTVLGVVRTIVLTPSSTPILAINGTLTLSASALDRRGLPLARAIAWASRNSGVASVTAAGVVKGLQDGSTFVIASSGTVTDSVRVLVHAPIARVVIAPASPLILLASDSITLTATPFDSGGTALLGRTVAWVTGDTGVVQIGPGTGVAKPVWSGHTVVTATIDGVSATAAVTVPMPITGSAVASLATFDSAISSYMRSRRIPAGVLAIMYHGRMVFSRGYGWMDQARTTPVPPNAVFRLASVTKPMTEAAIRLLMAQGKISDTTTVFPLLGLTPLPAGSTVADQRIFSITVNQLLNHEGGWDAPGSLIDVRMVASQLGLTRPATAAETAQWMMTQPLQFAPGSRSSYSNFGYALLGLAIEKVTGQSFVGYIQSTVEPTAASEIIAAQDLPANRDSREPRYSDPYFGCSVYVIASCLLVPYPDGGLEHASFAAAGGLAASARGVLTFLNDYWIDGTPRTPGSIGYYTWTWFGSLPGTFTLTRQRFDDINIVALFDQRVDPSGLLYDSIQGILDQTADAIVTWP